MQSASSSARFAARVPYMPGIPSQRRPPPHSSACSVVATGRSASLGERAQLRVGAGATTPPPASSTGRRAARAPRRGGERRRRGRGRPGRGEAGGGRARAPDGRRPWPRRPAPRAAPGPGRPLAASAKASSTSAARSSPCSAVIECLTTGTLMPATSVSWKAIVPRRWVATWPQTNTTGTESIHASATAVSRFTAPGPLVASATPGRPVTRAQPSAAWPPPASWRVRTWRMELAASAS